jgi:preprotein translocase subunit SecE
MGENANAENAPKKDWYKGLKTEFNKIIWPDKKSLGRQTTAVVAISIVLGLVISLLDAIIKYGVDFLVK